MIEELKPYESYRAAVAGLPSLPAHWALRRTKSLLREIDRRTKTGTQRLLSLRMNAGLVDHHAMGGKHIPSSSLVGYKHILPGELVMNRMRAAIGLFGAASSEGLVSPDYAIFDVRPELKVEYAVALFKTPMMASLFRLESRGLGTGESGFLRLYSDRFGIIGMPLPPPEEQEAIVRFLDHANRRIDQFIRSKKKLIALLNEQKQAIIHRAVTRGLDPNVTFKDSGVPWVSEMPAHWQLTPNRAHLRVRKVLVGARHREYQLLSLTKRGVIIRDLSENKGKFSSDMGTSQEVRAGDLVFCLFDVPETPRTVGLSSHNGMITGAYTVMECRDLSIARFLEAFYIAMDDSKLLSPLYSGLRNTIPKDRLLGAKTPIPPAGERERILSFIAKETRAIQAGIDRTSAEIALVQEYRARLVADVVTGQLDVRTAAAGLPVVEPEAAPTEIEGDETDIEDGEAA